MRIDMSRQAKKAANNKSAVSGKNERKREIYIGLLFNEN